MSTLDIGTRENTSPFPCNALHDNNDSDVSVLETVLNMSESTEDIYYSTVGLTMIVITDWVRFL